MRPDHPSPSASAPDSTLSPTASVAVVGAGPVGLALGLLLAQRCPALAVHLYDARSASVDVSGDARTLALSLGSIQLLRQLKAWPEAEAEPILKVRVSQEAAAVGLAGLQPSVTLAASALDVPQLGAVIRYGKLVHALQQAWDRMRAQQPHRLHAHFGHPVAGLKAVAEGGVEVDAGVVDRHRLAVVAEGGVYLPEPSQAAQVGWAERLRSGAPWVHDYGQTAWVGTVTLEGAERGLAVERFSRHGPVALLPLPSPDGLRRQAALVWCVDARDDPVPNLDDRQRLTVLASLLPGEAGTPVAISPLKHFPLGLKAHGSLVQDGCIVRIGNAAQTLHPVAGQGLNLGLRDAHALAQALREDLQAALRRVQWARQPDRLAMIAATDFLARSFTWDLPGAATLRGLGLALVENLGPVKTALARQMMFGRR